MVGALLASWFVARSLIRPLLEVNQRIGGTLEQANAVGSKLRETAGGLAESAAQQAAAIQESVSALEEVSSMIAQTARGTAATATSARALGEKSSGSRTHVEGLLSSMDSIENANSELQGLTEIIKEISQKTQVIHDIVFKTQLLSFNASIEAARANQYGKGFAVVAEEVGNLAQLSGHAAADIENLLVNSQKKVAQALEQIRGRVQEGKIASDHVARAFQEVTLGLELMQSQIQGAAEATAQQELGLEQTQKAIAILNQAAGRTSQSAELTKTSSESLVLQNQGIEGARNALELVVSGKVRAA